MRNFQQVAANIRTLSAVKTWGLLAGFGGRAVHSVRQTTGKLTLLSPRSLPSPSPCAETTGFSCLLYTVLPLIFPRAWVAEHIYYSGVLPTIHRTYNNNDYSYIRNS